MLLNVAAQNVSIQNVRVSKRERHITYSVTKRTASKNVKCTLGNCYKTFCNGTRFVTMYVMLHLRFGPLMLCAATFCNTMSCDVYVMLLYVCSNIVIAGVNETSLGSTVKMQINFFLRVHFKV